MSYAYASPHVPFVDRTRSVAWSRPTVSEWLDAIVSSKLEAVVPAWLRAVATGVNTATADRVTSWGVRDRRRLPRVSAHRFGDGHHDADDAAEDVLEAIRERAHEVHSRLAHDNDVFAVELLGATGAGKTALIERLLETTHGDESVGVIAGDVSGTDDADRLRAYGVPVANVTTGKDCHLDPERVDDALAAFDLAALDAVYVENVGNMVCPADFPLGVSRRVVVVSPTEGDDVVRKHPHLFRVADVVVVNKVDIAAAVGADVDRMVADAREIAPETPVVRTSATTGEGVDRLASVLDDTEGHGES